jgi:ABC-type phosphate transport system substrate-binding protein
MVIFNFFYLDNFNRYFIFLVFILAPICCFSTDNNNASNTSIQIVVNSSVPDKTYTLADVRAIFAMRKTRWNDGKKIQVFVLSDNDPIHRQLTKTKLNMFPHQFRRTWDRLIFSGIGQGPHQVESIDEMREKIAEIPGAIGYLEMPVNNKNIKVLNYE